jgi:hypothetical protein
MPERQSKPGIPHRANSAPERPVPSQKIPDTVGVFVGLFASKRILQTADGVLDFPCDFVAFSFGSNFVSPVTFPTTSFTVPFACYAEPLIRSLSICGLLPVKMPNSEIEG